MLCCDEELRSIDREDEGRSIVCCLHKEGSKEGVGENHQRLTFDVRGGRKWAKPACERPLDGGVRRQVRHMVETDCGRDLGAS